jgi:geranyl-CoA carboxylase alpha subunit
LLQRAVPDDEAWCVAAVALALRDGVPDRPASVAAYDLPLVCDTHAATPRVRCARDGRVEVMLAGTTHTLRLVEWADRTLCYEWQGLQRRGIALWHRGELHLALNGAVHVFREPSPVPETGRRADARRAVAPVAGVVVKIAVEPGDSVAAGHALVCVEAMKMEMWVSAGAAGRVARLVARVGQQVAAGALLAELEFGE